MHKAQTALCQPRQLLAQLPGFFFLIAVFALSGKSRVAVQIRDDSGSGTRPYPRQRGGACAKKKAPIPMIDAPHGV